MTSEPRAWGVVPAAGRSTRMGRPKLLLPWQGQPILEHVLAAWKASAVECVVVVVHPDDVEIAELARRCGAETIVPDEPPPDMKASVGHALRFLAERFAPRDNDLWLLSPADVPRLDDKAIDFVIAAARKNPGRIVVPRHNDRRGHPVALPWALAAEVATLPADQGVNALLERHGVVEVDYPEPTILADLDTPDDYRRLREEDI